MFTLELVQWWLWVIRWASNSLAAHLNSFDRHRDIHLDIRLDSRLDSRHHHIYRHGSSDHLLRRFQRLHHASSRHSIARIGKHKKKMYRIQN